MLKQGIPRHKQISNWVRKQIESGEYHEDEKLPSENELTKQFDVSRVTVRKALQTLENEGLIYRCQGLGSFVSESGRRSFQSFGSLTDFVEDMKQAGIEAASKLLQLKPVPAPDQIASLLAIEENSTVVRLDRLRLGDGEPIALDITWLPMFYGQLVENYNLEQKTIYDILEQNYNIPVEKGYYRIEAENATYYLSKNLQIDKNDALLLIDRLSLTVGDKPIYYQKRYYRTDKIVYELLVEREQKGQMPLQEFSSVFNSQP